MRVVRGKGESKGGLGLGFRVKGLGFMVGVRWVAFRFRF